MGTQLDDRFPQQAKQRIEPLFLLILAWHSRFVTAGLFVRLS